MIFCRDEDELLLGYQRGCGRDRGLHTYSGMFRMSCLTVSLFPFDFVVPVLLILLVRGDGIRVTSRITSV